MFKKLLTSAGIALFAASLAACSSSGLTGVPPSNVNQIVPAGGQPSTLGGTMHKMATYSQPETTDPSSGGGCGPGQTASTDPNTGQPTCLSEIGSVSSNCGAECQAIHEPCMACNGATGNAFSGGNAPFQRWPNCIDPVSTPSDCPAIPPEIIADFGTPAAGRQCATHDAAPSPAIGEVLDGKPDTKGVNGNEVKQVYYIDFNSGGGSRGALNAPAGYIAVTFNHETWYEPPIVFPFYSGVPVIGMGNVSVTPNGTIGSNTLYQTMINWANNPNNISPSEVKNAVKSFASNLMNKGTNATVFPCFDKDWNAVG